MVMIKTMIRKRVNQAKMTMISLGEGGGIPGVLGGEYSSCGDC